MAARTGLKESLNEITALMGLLRSDLIELSETPPDGPRRAPVMSHMHWIADRFDELGPALGTEAGRRPAQTARRKPAARTSPSRPAAKAVAPKAEVAPPDPAADAERETPRPEAEPPSTPEPIHSDPDRPKPLGDAG